MILPNYQKMWTEFESIPKVGFTGSRSLTEKDRWILEPAIEAIPDRVVIVTGACVGVDAQIARIATEHRKYVHTIVPADRTRVDPFFVDYCVSYEEMPPSSEPYRDRNQRIVDYSNVLIAFPAYKEEHPKSRRSGTWMTVRMARKQGVPARVHALEDVLKARGYTPGPMRITNAHGES